MNVKEKGNRFERSISIKLSLWASEGKDKNLFWRSDSSGARATTSKDKLSNQVGDIAADSKIAYDLLDKFLIECKHYKNIGLDNFVWRTNKSSENVYNWWLRYKKQAYEHSKSIMLICKQNNKKDLLLVEANFINIFEVKSKDIKMVVRDLGCYVLILDDFLEMYDFKLIYV